MRKTLIFLAAFFLLAGPAFAPLGVLPYHAKQTTRTGTGDAAKTSGDFLMGAPETAGTSVTIKAGSFIRWRTF